MPEILISIKNLLKTYKTNGEEVHAIKGVSFDILKGESIAVMGQSGSGKSTLLSIIGGLNQPSSGKIRIDGVDIYSLSQEKRADFRRDKLGFVFQQFQLIPYLTAIENIMLPLTTLKISNKKKRDLAMSVLLRVGLEKEQNRLPNQLSGGEQERVAIARAIVNSPPLILADEPTGSLDTKTGEAIMEIFRDLNRDGLTILMVTHNPENTLFMDRTILMKDGVLCNDEKELHKFVPTKEMHKII